MSSPELNAPMPVSILIVEDSAIQAEALRRILAGAGYAVSVARDGAEGVDRARQLRPGLIISDIIMPKMDGFELCREIKSDPELRVTPVVLLTALADTGDVLRGLECGADNFITKPYNAAYLLSRLDSVLSGAAPGPHDEVRDGITVNFAGNRYVITADRERILSTLLTIYETAVKKNEELLTAQSEMRILNGALEQKIRERTVALTEEIEIRKRAQERLRHHAKRMQAFDEVSLALSRSVGEYRAALAIVVRKAAEMVGECCVLSLVSDDGQWLEPAAFHHRTRAVNEPFCRHFAEIPYPLGPGLPGAVALSGAPVIVPDLARDEARTGIAPDVLPYLERGGVRTLLAVPLVTHGETIGIISLFRGAGAAYGRDDLSFVKELADRAALTIYNARLYEKAQRRMNNLQALHAMDLAVLSGFNLNATLDIFLAEALQQLQMDAASVLLLEKPSQTLRLAAGKGFSSDAVKQVTVSGRDGHLGRIVRERTLVAVPDLAEDRDFLAARSCSDEDFVMYLGVPVIIKGEVRGVLELFHRSQKRCDPEWLAFLATLAGQAGIAIENSTLFSQLQRSNADLRQAYDSTLEGWSRALDLRDNETEGHSRRVTELTVKLAREVCVAEDEIEQVWRGALLHDIGKMGIPDAILLKSAALTTEEWNIMRRHPDYARDLLWPIEFLRPALDIPYCHHEKWDGTGYPRGLKGEDIPLSARLFAVVDVWDALRSDRPYRAGWEAGRVLEHIRSLAGTHFDPRVVQLFLRIVDEGEPV